MTQHTFRQLYTALEEFREVGNNETVSNESIRQFLTNRAPKLVSLLSDVFRTLSTWDYSQPEVFNVRSIEGVLRKADFQELEGVLMMKPVGFNTKQGPLDVYAQQLLDGQADSLVLTKDVLSRVQDVLSEYVSDPEALKERARESRVLKEQLTALTQYKEREAPWLVEGNRTHEADFTVLFHNLKAFSETARLVNAVNAKRWSVAPPKEVAMRGQSLSRVAEALQQIMEGGGVVPHRDTLLLLASEIELAALWLEWYSVLTTRIMDLTAAMKTNERKLMRVL